MFNKFLLRVTLAIVAVMATLAISNPSFATSGTGKVTVYHLNGDWYGRGVCVRTSPSLPGDGWGCVWYRDQLYKEFEELLLFAYINGRTCTISWNELDRDGHGLVDLVECD